MRSALHLEKREAFMRELAPMTSWSVASVDCLNVTPLSPPKILMMWRLRLQHKMAIKGMNIGRSASLLAGIPQSVPGYSVDRWCAGALTSVTTLAGSIAIGAYNVALAGGVEHMGNHPMGDLIGP